MKNKILIIIGSLLFFIALINNIIDIRSLINVNFQNISNEFQSAVQKINIDSNFISNEEVTSQVISTDNRPDLTQISPILQVENFTATPEPEGFLPLQLEKKISTSLIASTPITNILPNRIIISSIELDAPIIQSKKEEVEIESKTFIQWYAPDEFAVGWQNDSATLGEKGNTVLNGHHNVHDEVFKNLEKVKEGDRIIIYGSADNQFTYVVTNIMILPERDVSLDQRLDNAKWMLSTVDERITIITCWPYYSNTHRLIIVARPEIIDFKEIIQ